MKGDSGSPCLIPLEGAKGESFSPLKSKEVEEEEMQLIINLIVFGGTQSRLAPYG